MLQKLSHLSWELYLQRIGSSHLLLGLLDNVDLQASFINVFPKTAYQVKECAVLVPDTHKYLGVLLDQYLRSQFLHRLLALTQNTVKRALLILALGKEGNRFVFLSNSYLDDFVQILRYEWFALVVVNNRYVIDQFESKGSMALHSIKDVVR